MSLRVRQVLDKAGANGRRSLTKHLPAYSLPEDTKGTFPAAILNSYTASDSKYSEVGLLTEHLLFCPVVDKSVVLKYIPNTSTETRSKIEKSKTTDDFVHKLNRTRDLLSAFVYENGGFLLNQVLLDQEFASEKVSGHPDGVYRNNTHRIIVEIKTSSKLDADHPYFMAQLCSYLGLCMATDGADTGVRTFGVLVLPLQSAIVVVDGDGWSGRSAFMKTLDEKAAKTNFGAKPTLNMMDLFNVNQLIRYYSIGAHVPKQKTLLQTVVNMRPGIPFQIFIGNNMSSRINIDQQDLAAAGEWVRNNNIILYIHAPYVINLATVPEDNWNVEYMIKTMRYGSSLGARGVVLHVGKSTDQSIDKALNNMFCGVAAILEHTDANCPLLLETPAGQGTEMFRKSEEFADFICQYRDIDPSYGQKLGACIDTCHVFACGYVPSEYIKYAHSREMVRLVHYNDSNDICGSCKDRHAMVGQGHIGIGEMTAVADFCGQYNIPMVVE